MPYIYLDNHNHTIIKKFITTLFTGFTCNDQYCYEYTYCDNIDISGKNISFRLGPVGQGNQFTLNIKDFLISGDKVGLATNQCILAIFLNTYNQYRWNVGNIFIKRYYTVFDMSPHVDQ